MKHCSVCKTERIMIRLNCLVIMNWIPVSSIMGPRSPRGPYSIISERPTTAVGTAMGRSMRDLNTVLPGNLYLVIT